MKMKAQLAFIMLLVLLTCSGYAQERMEKEKNEKINKLVETLKQYQPGDVQILVNNLKKLEDKKLKEVLKVFYEALEIAPFEVNKILENDQKRVNDIVVERSLRAERIGRRDTAGIKIETDFKEIHEAFKWEAKRRYSTLISALIFNPVVVKAKVKSFRKENEKLKLSGDAGFVEFPRKTLTLVKETLIKGKAGIVEKPEFEAHYRDWQEQTLPDFKEGYSYLFFLTNLVRINMDYPWAIDIFIDENSGSRFVVINDELSDAENVFGMGEKVKWNQLEQKINDLIYKIKNMLEY